MILYLIAGVIVLVPAVVDALLAKIMVTGTTYRKLTVVVFSLLGVLLWPFLLLWWVSCELTHKKEE